MVAGGASCSRLSEGFEANRQRLRPGNLDLHCGDFLQVSYYGAGLVDGAGLVVCYLFPRGMQQLRPRFEEELPAGTVVISNTFPVPGRRAVRILYPESDPHYPIHVYRVPDAFTADVHAGHDRQARR